MISFEQYCAEQDHTLGAPVENVPQTMCKLANEYGKEQRAKIASELYQALGCIDPDVLPDGEWLRVMNWLSASANMEEAGDLLPVNCTELYIDKLQAQPITPVTLRVGSARKLSPPPIDENL